MNVQQLTLIQPYKNSLRIVFITLSDIDKMGLTKTIFLPEQFNCVTTRYKWLKKIKPSTCVVNVVKPTNGG
jgi:hypothetical protein